MKKQMRSQNILDKGGKNDIDRSPNHSLYNLEVPDSWNGPTNLLSKDNCLKEYNSKNRATSSTFKHGEAMMGGLPSQSNNQSFDQSIQALNKG